MRTKIFIPAILICIFSFNMSSIASEVVETKKATTEVNTESSKIAASLLISRLHEIQAMTKKDLSSSEKAALKKEVRGIQQELKSMGGIYISVGVLILILILIIIL